MRLQVKIERTTESKKPGLVILPVYNEEANLSRVINEIGVHQPELDIVVIDDGSTDRSKVVARSCGVKVISLAYNLGYGAALQVGFMYAAEKDYDFIVQMDADGQHDPGSITQLLEPIKDNLADVVIGSRFLDGEYTPSFVRQVGIVIFRMITSFIIRQKITDPTSGFQAISRAVLQFYVGDFYPCDFPDADVIILTHLAGFRIVEVPVKMYPPQKGGKSMHRGVLMPLYYLFKMLVSILVTLLRQRPAMGLIGGRGLTPDRDADTHI